METRISRLRTHQKNIDRYQGLLKTKLNEIERQYIERRLSEERFTIALLQFMSAPKGFDFRSGHWNRTGSLDPGLSVFAPRGGVISRQAWRRLPRNRSRRRDVRQGLKYGAARPTRSPAAGLGTPRLDSCLVADGWTRLPRSSRIMPTTRQERF